MGGLAAKGKIVGFDYVELVPGFDIGSQTSLFAARIILSLIGVLAHKGQI
jgi:arginase family enzyme